MGSLLHCIILYVHKLQLFFVHYVHHVHIIINIVWWFQCFYMFTDGVLCCCAFVIKLTVTAGVPSCTRSQHGACSHHRCWHCWIDECSQRPEVDSWCQGHHHIGQVQQGHNKCRCRRSLQTYNSSSQRSAAGNCQVMLIITCSYVVHINYNIIYISHKKCVPALSVSVLWSTRDIHGST